MATAGEKLLGDKHGERRADRAPDDADRLPGKVERIELRMVAGPGLERLGFAALPQPSNHVAIGIENADRGDIRRWQSLLPAGLAQ